MLKDFIKILFFKPEESFKEIFESINILEENANKLYFNSYKKLTLTNMLNCDIDVGKLKEEIIKLEEVMNNILIENENINLNITINLICSSLLTLVSCALMMVNLPLWFSLFVFLINFFISYLFAYLSEVFQKVMINDKRSNKYALAELQRIENILHNTRKNILQNVDNILQNNKINISKYMEFNKENDLFNKAQEVLNSYLDNNIVLPMDNDTVMYLVKMLQSDLKTDECDLMKLLELAKQNNNSITLKRTK